MIWIFLSPHFDDAVYSCGGLIWELRQRGEPVEIWTVCSGIPAGLDLSPFARELHARWGVDGEVVVAIRQNEDAQACARVGAAVRYFGLLDCIYRDLAGDGALVTKEEDLWQPVHPAEAGLVEGLVEAFGGQMHAGVELVSPMGLGEHVDHRLTRLAAEKAAARFMGINLQYYADVPYVFRLENRLPEAVRGWTREGHAVSAEGLAAWQDGVACYESQLSSFWSSAAEMRGQIAGYAEEENGCALYRRSRISHGESQ
jgi:LmbE family N-acetylglucosaminyl deacetylase